MYSFEFHPQDYVTVLSVGKPTPWGALPQWGGGSALDLGGTQFPVLLVQLPVGATPAELEASEAGQVEVGFNMQ